MINLFRKHRGIATLLITLLLIVTITLIVFFAANFGLMQQKVTSNQYRTNQAYEAAEAGFEFAIPYLQANRATIIASPTSGFINYSNSSTTNITLANNSRFTVVYTNPIANNYDLIRITSTGTSADGQSVRVISQLTQRESLLTTSPTSPLITKGSVSMTGSAKVINTTSNTTIQSGSTVTISGSAETVTQGGGSDASQINADVQQNASDLSSISDNDLFASYFGTSPTGFKNNVSNYYSNSSNTDYSSTLNGKTGTTIWIDQASGTTASLSGSPVIGSAAQPVIMVINGDFRLTGSATIYGLVYVIGGTDADILGSSNIIGGLVSTGNLSLKGSTEFEFNPTVLDNIQNSQTYYAKVPGSWKDF